MNPVVRLSGAPSERRYRTGLLRRTEDGSGTTILARRKPELNDPVGSLWGTIHGWIGFLCLSSANSNLARQAEVETTQVLQTEYLSDLWLDSSSHPLTLGTTGTAHEWEQSEHEFNVTIMITVCDTEIADTTQSRLGRRDHCFLILYSFVVESNLRISKGGTNATVAKVATIR